MKTIIWILVLSPLLWLIHKRAKKGIKRNLEQLEFCIEALLNRGYSDGYLVIYHASSNKFIQFNKYIINEKKFGIEMAFPDAKWSSRYYTKLTTLLKDNEILFEEDISSDLKFLIIDCQKDSQKAFSLVKLICRDVFMLDENQKYYVLLNNAALQ